jgi:hypothetical protein
MIFPIAIINLFIFEFIGINLKNKKKFTNIKLLLILSLSSFIIVFGWYYYAIWYNKINGDTYFLTHTAPIWELSRSTIYIIFDLISNYWKNDYYYPTTFHTIYILIIFSFIFIKKANKLLFIFNIILFLGTTSYFFLFFEKFRDHDYYALPFVPTLMLIILNSFIIIKKQFKNKNIKIVVLLYITALVILSTKYSIKRSTKRYHQPYEDNYIFNKFNGIKPKLDSLKISNNSTFVVVGDFSRNGSLYYMNKKGWTITNTNNISITELKQALKNKPNYLIITEKKYLQNNTIKSIDKDFIFEYNKMNIYKLY